MSLKSRIERLEQGSRKTAPTLLWMDEGQSVEDARAKAGLQPDDPVIVFRWRSEAEAGADGAGTG